MDQDVPNTPSFNLVQCSISKLLTNDYYDVLSKYFNLEIDRTVRVKVGESINYPKLVDKKNSYPKFGELDNFILKKWNLCTV